MVFQRVSMTAILSIEYFFLQRVIQQCIESIQTPRQYVQLYMKQYFPAVENVYFRAPNESFILNALKTLFSLSSVLFYL